MLIYRPPTSYSYPWYDVIENLEIEHHVLVGEALSFSSMLSPGANPNESCISINGTLWRIEETISPNQEYVVSWGQYPMRWRLKLHREKTVSIQDRLEALEIDLLDRSDLS